MDHASVDLVEERHHDERVEYDGKVDRRGVTDVGVTSAVYV